MRIVCIFFSFLALLVLLACASVYNPSKGPLAGRIICIDPGHGGTAMTDDYRAGPTGEREEWINLRVAMHLKDLLEKKGARILLTRSEDVQVELKARALLAVEHGADAFVSIHHNATADRYVNFPIIYYHGNGSENRASVQLAQLLAVQLDKALFRTKGVVSVASDHVIFPRSGTAVLRHSYGIPGIIGEASFFTNPDEEIRLRNSDYNRIEAQAYAEALESFFKKSMPSIHGKYSTGRLPSFEVFQEEDRMNISAQRWYENFVQGEQIFMRGDPDSLGTAYDLLTRSVRAFPDSWVGKKCHQYRSQLLRLMGRPEEADIALKRSREYYVDVRIEKSIIY